MAFDDGGFGGSFSPNPATLLPDGPNRSTCTTTYIDSNPGLIPITGTYNLDGTQGSLNLQVYRESSGKFAGPGGRVQFRTLSLFGARQSTFSPLEPVLIVRTGSKIDVGSLGLVNHSQRSKSLAAVLRSSSMEKTLEAVGRAEVTTKRKQITKIRQIYKLVQATDAYYEDR